MTFVRLYKFKKGNTILSSLLNVSLFVLQTSPQRDHRGVDLHGNEKASVAPEKSNLLFRDYTGKSYKFSSV